MVSASALPDPMPDPVSGPTERARELVAGAYDAHVHVSPDVMERRIDDLSLARRFAAVGFGGFVLKSHYVPTAERPPWCARRCRGRMCGAGSC